MESPALLRAIARLACRHPRAVVLAFALAAAVGGAYGSGVAAHLEVGGLEDPGSESAQVQRILHEELGVADPDAIAVFGDPSRPAHDPSVRAALQRSLQAVRRDPGVEALLPPPDDPRAAMLSADGTRLAVLLDLAGGATEKQETLERIELSLRSSGVPVEFGGELPARLYAQRAAMHDVGRAELLCLPIVAALLLWFFRGPAGAALPLAVGAFAVPSALAVIRVLAEVAHVSVFALNVSTFLGIGLSIDYALLLVTRFREELAAGRGVDDAIERTLATSGRAILVSGLLVATSLLALLAFPIVIIRTIGTAGALVVVCALVGSLLLLPAMLRLAGGRSGRFRIGPARADETSGAWHRLATAVMRRPAPVALAVLVALAALGLPFLRARSVLPDVKMFPPESEVRQVDELLAAPSGFGSLPIAPLLVLLETRGSDPASSGRVADALARLRSLPGVRNVEAPRAIRGGRTLVRVAASAPWRSEETRDLVARVRALDAGSLRVLVGGPTAAMLDARDALQRRLPLAIALIVGVNLVALLVAFRSCVVPLKAVAMNAISLSASFGVLVWVFQDGHGSALLGFEPPGGIDVTVMIVLFAIVFGLSMDYEVFLLSSIQEEYRRTGDNRASVAAGLERTGAIITRAALLLVVVVAAFAAGELIFVKELGVGMAAAIAIDATVVRALLVPATMALLGDANWWMPAPFRRVRRLRASRDHGDEDAAPSIKRASWPLSRLSRRRSPPRRGA